jgi:ABC-2 type transport system ATP-binding protein
MHSLEIKGLKKSYNGKQVVADISLNINSGEVVGLLGPNGAGKTTAMRVLLDFLRPTSGSARVLGLDCRSDSLAIRARCGYLGGDVRLYRRLTGRQLCEWLGSLRGGAGIGRIEPLADRLGLDLDRPIADLSTGNRQKVALVQAFIHEPELLILDEPTAGLDPLVKHTFQQMVHEVAAEGRTVFLSSHLLDEVERTCDRVGIIRAGRLVAVEEMATLRRRALREVTVRFGDPVDLGPFEALEGVHDVAADGDLVHLRYGGEADALVKLVARYQVLDFVSAPADLEDVFLAFYSDGDPARD